MFIKNLNEVVNIISCFMQQNILNCSASLCRIQYILNFPSFQHHMTWPPPPGLWVNSDMMWVIYKRTWLVYLPLEEDIAGRLTMFLRTLWALLHCPATIDNPN